MILNGVMVSTPYVPYILNVMTYILGQIEPVVRGMYNTPTSITDIII